MRRSGSRHYDTIGGYFNPRTREGCDQVLGHAQTQRHIYFNPRTREGCDHDGNTVQLFCKTISIHAPVKGATFQGILHFQIGFVDFNPRTREGCDRTTLAEAQQDLDISIHAPVKGATPAIGQLLLIDFIISIHAPVKGATPYPRP